MLTPMSKYYCSEMCNRVALQRHPGAGRLGLHEGLRGRALLPRRPHHHDLRRHQPVAGRGGGPRRVVRGLRDLDRRARQEGLRRSAAGRVEAEAARGQGGGSSRPIQFIKSQGAVLPRSGPAGGWSIRRLPSSSAICCWARAPSNERKKRVARRFIDREMPVRAHEPASRFTPATRRRWTSTRCWPAPCRPTIRRRQAAVPSPSGRGLG